MSDREACLHKRRMPLHAFSPYLRACVSQIQTNCSVRCQETGGHGIGEAVGLAGVTNLDIVRNPDLSKAPYLARLIWHHIIPLGRKKIDSSRSPLSLFSLLPERRLEIRFGKFSLADFFDTNTYGTDTAFQFMNWTVDNNGAYDYAADTRGFTFATMLEYHERRWAVRFAEALMPKVANGIHLDADMSRARAENIEFELHGTMLRHQEGTIRFLSFINHANMGSYREAIGSFLSGLTLKPDITAHPLHTTVKYGFGLNFEQPLNGWLSAFGRWGGTRAGMSHLPIRKWIRQWKLAWAAKASRGIENSTARAGICFERHLARPPGISRSWWFRFSSRRRPSQLPPREHYRKLLHAACLARTLSFVWPAAHQQSWLQPRPGTGSRADPAAPSRVLNTGIAKLLGSRPKVC